jgi:LuxR family maltose regulon positive regulatory protein
VRATQAERTARDDLAIEEFFESKLHPPPAREALVSRAELVDRLVGANDVPIASVVAPAGYGKTTVLAEWAHRESSRVAWLSLDRHDNDLGVLLPYLAAALDRVEPGNLELLQATTRRRSVAAAAARIASAMSDMPEPVVLVLDHIELLDNAECVDTIAELALHLPPGSRLAFASRSEPPLPMPRLRARGDLVEIGVDDLAMSFPEARALLRNAGVAVGDEEVERLLERTEGWPVGLYLAALALKTGGSRPEAGIAFSGDDRLIADYLRSEVLDNLSRGEVEFLTRTSVLERLTAPLCDTVLDVTGSREMLDALARSNLLLVSLDRQGTWYRYHHLFRDLLRAELEVREPDILPELHLRAAEWCEANDLPELAIDHAQAAGDADRVNRLVLVHAVGAYANGRGTSVRRWLYWFHEQGLVAQYPAAAVVGALVFTSSGMTTETEYWTEAVAHPNTDLTLADGTRVAERAAPDRLLPDGSTLESWRALLRVITAPHGFAGVRSDAHIALDGLSPSSGYRAVAIACIAMCDLFDGELDRADEGFAYAAEFGMQRGRTPVVVIALCERGIIAASRADWETAAEFAQQARSIIEVSGLDDYSEAAYAYALTARVAARNGETGVARDALTRAARLRPQLNHSRPMPSTHTLLELARAYIALDDTGGAREVLRQAREILRRRPGLDPVAAQVGRLAAHLDTMHSGTVGASSLTAAELRLVPFLPTHLTFPQIAERLYVSRNTVKSQAISVYQKLGVSSRGDAVQRLQELGLIED